METVRNTTEKPSLRPFENYAIETFSKLDDAALVSVRVAASVKNCSVETIFRRLRSGQLESHRDGNMRRIVVRSLRASMRTTP